MLFQPAPMQQAAANSQCSQLSQTMRSFSSDGAVNAGTGGAAVQTPMQQLLIPLRRRSSPVQTATPPSLSSSTISPFCLTSSYATSSSRPSTSAYLPDLMFMSIHTPATAPMYSSVATTTATTRGTENGIAGAVAESSAVKPPAAQAN